MEILLVFQFKKIKSLGGAEARAKEEELKVACAQWTASYGTPVRLQESFGDECLHLLVVFQYPQLASAMGDEADELIASLQEDMGEWIRDRRFGTPDIWLEDVFSDTPAE